VGKRFQEHIAPGQFLGYKRPASGGAGSWSARRKVGASDRLGGLGTADDGIAADGADVLTYQQAMAAAVKWCQGQERREAEGDAVDGAETQAPGGAEPPPKGRATVAYCLEAYFKDQERRGKKGSGRARQSAAAWILPALGAIEVARLTRGRIESWHNAVADSPKRLRTGVGQDQRHAPLPASDDEKRARKDSANRILAILKAALTFAVDRRLADSGDMPWTKAKPFPQTTKARIRFLQPDEATRLVNVSTNVCGREFADLVRGALLTGCRYGELARLRCMDFDSGNASVLIAESKSGKSRHVFLAEEGRALFEGLTAGKAANSLIFTNSAKRRRRGALEGAWAESDQVRLMQTVCEAAGLEHIGFHRLRHSCASMLINRGCPLPVIAQLLGHSDTRMAERHYGHLAPSYIVDTVRAVMPTLGIVEPSVVQKLKISGA